MDIWKPKDYILLGCNIIYPGRSLSMLCRRHWKRKKYGALKCQETSTRLHATHIPKYIILHSHNHVNLKSLQTFTNTPAIPIYAPHKSMPKLSQSDNLWLHGLSWILTLKFIIQVCQICNCPSLCNNAFLTAYIHENRRTTLIYNLGRLLRWP